MEMERRPPSVRGFLDHSLKSRWETAPPARWTGGHEPSPSTTEPPSFQSRSWELRDKKENYYTPFYKRSQEHGGKVPFEKSVAEVSLWQFLQNQVDAVITVCYNQLSKSEVAEGTMEKLSVLSMSILLMVVAIICDLFSNKIDTALKGDKQVKKVIVIFSVGVLLICAIAIISILS